MARQCPAPILSPKKPGCPLSQEAASIPPLLMAVAAIIIVYLLVNNTRWGLRLKAIGLNAQTASRMGINTTGNMLLAFAVCGATGGISRLPANHCRSLPFDSLNIRRVRLPGSTRSAFISVTS